MSDTILKCNVTSGSLPEHPVLTLSRCIHSQAEFKSLAPSRLWDSGSAEPRAPTFKRTLAAHLRRIASRGAQPSDAPDAEVRLERLTGSGNRDWHIGTVP